MVGFFVFAGEEDKGRMRRGWMMWRVLRLIKRDFGLTSGM